MQGGRRTYEELAAIDAEGVGDELPRAATSIDQSKYRRPVVAAVHLSTFGGASRTASLRLDEMIAQPFWTPLSVLPVTLSVNEAIRLSADLVQFYTEESSAWHVTGVSLVSVSVGIPKEDPYNYVERWYYVVSWRPRAGSSTEFLNLPVLLSGTAIMLDTPETTSYLLGIVTPRFSIQLHDARQSRNGGP